MGLSSPAAYAHIHPTAVAPQRTIALNRKAKRDFHLEERFEAGLALEGWEVKSLRAGKAQVASSYVHVRGGEAWLLGVQITPLPAAAERRRPPHPERDRKLLLQRRELARLSAAIQQKGYTCLCTALYWKKHLVKCEIALARGKHLHDKREDEKQRDWEREQQRLLRGRRD